MGEGTAGHRWGCVGPVNLVLTSIHFLSKSCVQKSHDVHYTHVQVVSIASTCRKHEMEVPEACRDACKLIPIQQPFRALVMTRHYLGKACSKQRRINIESTVKKLSSVKDKSV